MVTDNYRRLRRCLVLTHGDSLLFNCITTCTLTLHFAFLGKCRLLRNCPVAPAVTERIDIIFLVFVFTTAAIVQRIALFSTCRSYFLCNVVMSLFFDNTGFFRRTYRTYSLFRALFKTCAVFYCYPVAPAVARCLYFCINIAYRTA